MPRYAAIDIGSNSLRLLIAEVDSGGAIREVAGDREVTRLGESVFRDGRVSEAALSEVAGVLRRFSEAIRKNDCIGVRAVATSAIRDTANQAIFLERASTVVGSPVEIISGLEEARLIHLGVQRRMGATAEKILILDVGGGSAEVILAEHGARKEAFSKPLGAVRLREMFLRHDPPLPVELQRMNQYIEQKLEPCVRRLGKAHFERFVGTSATAGALVCLVHRIPQGRRDEAEAKRVSATQLKRLYKDLAARDLADRRKLQGMGPRRAEIIIPGVAVFTRAMEVFGVTPLRFCAAGVREGIIADLAARGVGRERALLDRDQRRVVEQMARKYGVDVPHARQVANVANRLFEVLQPLHRLAPEAGRLLEASAYLHDTGHFISDWSHHKHSAYIVANSGMPGFTDSERHLIAMLCRFHRKSMPGLRHEQFQLLPDSDKHILFSLLPLLRLADSLDRSHAQRIEEIECEHKPSSVRLRVRSARGADLDLWAAERVADVFRQVYGKTLELENATS